MDYAYLYAKFGDYTLGRFGFIVRTHTRTDAAKRLTHATVVGVSNNFVILYFLQ